MMSKAWMYSGNRSALADGIFMAPTQALAVPAPEKSSAHLVRPSPCCRLWDWKRWLHESPRDANEEVATLIEVPLETW
jgi:hypothetical protein